MAKSLGRGYAAYTCALTKKTQMILDSSMVEHSAVNRVVVGSSPTRGVFPYQEKEENKAPWSSG